MTRANFVLIAACFADSAHYAASYSLDGRARVDALHDCAGRIADKLQLQPIARTAFLAACGVT